MALYTYTLIHPLVPGNRYADHVHQKTTNRFLQYRILSLPLPH